MRLPALNFKQRIHKPEIMDTRPVPEQEMKGGLEFLRFTNRVFGGSRVFIHYLSRYAKFWKKNEVIRILDVGSGLGDIPRAILAWAKPRSYQIQITGIDLMPQITLLAKKYCANEPDIDIKTGDIFSEDFKAGSYDYVIASLFLHHLEDAQIHLALKKFDSIAERGMMISDLYRSALSFYAVTLVSKLSRCAMVKHDGPQSVLNAFTVSDLENLIVDNQLPYLKAKKEPFFRVSLTGEKKWRG